MGNLSSSKVWQRSEPVISALYHLKLTYLTRVELHQQETAVIENQATNHCQKKKEKKNSNPSLAPHRYVLILQHV